MKSPLEVFFETCSNSLGRPNKARTLEEFQEEMTKDRILREGVEAVCEAMEKYATEQLQPALDAIATLQLRIVELEQKEVSSEQESI